MNNYEELLLVLDVADIQHIMGISRVNAYELVRTPGFLSFRSGRLNFYEMNGNRALIKREKFERYLDQATAV